jgi:hypothetical protein
MIVVMSKFSMVINFHNCIPKSCRENIIGQVNVLTEEGVGFTVQCYRQMRHFLLLFGGLKQESGNQGFCLLRKRRRI